MHRRSAALAAASAAASALTLTLAAGASAAQLSGVVAHDNPQAHSFVIATRTGKLTAVHARHLPKVGRVVKVSAKRLRNGTFAAKSIHVGRKTGHVRLRGTVTYASPRHHSFVVSARGVSVLIHQNRSRHHAHTAAATVPPVGTVVTVDGSPSDDGIDATAVHEDGQNLNGFDLEGSVEAIDATARTLTLSADDSEQSGATLTIQIPATFDITQFQVGESVELIVSPNSDGTYTLQQSSNDSGGHHADNPGEMQGDDHGDQQPNAEQQCLALSSDPTFPAAHGGLTFVQFYDPSDLQASDALSNCTDTMSGDNSGGSGGSGGSGSGGSGGSDGSGSGGSGGS